MNPKDDRKRGLVVLAAGLGLLLLLNRAQSSNSDASWYAPAPLGPGSSKAPGCG